MSVDDLDFLDGVSRPAVPAGLEERVLEAARREWSPERPRRLVDIVWESPAVRIGWVFGAAALFAANVAMSLASPPTYDASLTTAVIVIEEIPLIAEIARPTSVARAEIRSHREVLEWILHGDAHSEDSSGTGGKG